jgi:citrate lyase subunit beta/citryl-CoA lyase
MIQNASVFDADALIFDLEDAVSIDEKDAARVLVSMALETFDFKPSVRIVRVNPLDTVWGREDVLQIGKYHPDIILVPKADAESIGTCHVLLQDIEKQNGFESESIRILALIESASGVECATEIIKSSSRLDGILLGGEDFTADMQIRRTPEGRELFYARTRLATLCRAYGLQFIDTPYTNVNDPEGLAFDVREAVSLGATGKAAINPRQLEMIHQRFEPTEADVHWAVEVVDAWQQAKEDGKGVFALHGKMVDAPVFTRAEMILKQVGAVCGEGVNRS